MILQVAVVAVVLALGVGAGTRVGSATRWDEAVAHLVGEPGEVDFVTLEDLGTHHSTGFSPGWIRWIDADGTWHEDGLPDCVVDGAVVRYAWEPVSAAGGSWRETVLVDCRGG